MPQAVSNRVRLSAIEESVFNTTPASPAMRTLAYTSSSLVGEPETKISDTIVSNRNVKNLILVGKNVSGEVAYELQHLNPNVFYEGAMFSAWVTTAERLNETGAAQITAVAATTYTVTGALNFRQYHLIRATGFTNTANNKVFAAAAATSSTSLVHSGGTVEASPPSTARLKVIGVEGPSADIVATSTGLTATSVNFVNMGLVVGMWVYVGGNTLANQFATAGTRGWCRVAAVAAGSVTWDRKPAGWAADAGTGKTIRLYFGDYLRNGVTAKSYTLEQSFLDITQFQYITGARVANATLEAKAKSVMTGKMSFIGAGHTLVQSRVSGATDLAAPTGPSWNASSNVGSIFANGVQVTDPNYVMSFTLSLANNLREVTPLGFLTAQGINAGRCVVQAQLEAYFGDQVLLNYVLNNTLISYDMPILDANGDGMVIDIPSAKGARGSVAVPGTDQDLMVPIQLQALEHATLGYALQLQRAEAVGA